MNRTSFFKKIFGAAAAVVVAPMIPEVEPENKSVTINCTIKGDQLILTNNRRKLHIRDILSTNMYRPDAFNISNNV